MSPSATTASLMSGYRKPRDSEKGRITGFPGASASGGSSVKGASQSKSKSVRFSR